jgi:hypothetical protein
MASPPKRTTFKEIYKRWDVGKPPEELKKIIDSIMEERETLAGLYPDPDDARFAARLFSKREFYNHRAVAAKISEGSLNPCESSKANELFELTPVQKLVSRFMHPSTPYNGMLLYHGVGVGKTCSAVSIAEQALTTSPNKVILLVPQAIQDNFKRTIFDISKLKWDEKRKQWTSNQCTGTSYLERLGLMRNPDLHTIQYQIDVDRRSRYTITGYQAFANWIRRSLASQIPADLADPELRAAAENDILRRLFSDTMIIIDEAHNLRDTDGKRDSQTEEVAGESNENSGGKSLNPYLKRIVLNAEGLRMVLMSATPMYNSSPEIILLMNYLIMNDYKNERNILKMNDIFTKNGDIKETGRKALETAARRYVSYMRGENPYTFPIRLRPAEAIVEPWPTVSATRKPVEITPEENMAIRAMPFVYTAPVEGGIQEVLLREGTKRAKQYQPELEGSNAEEVGLGDGEGEGDGSEDDAEELEGSDIMLDLRMQMANICYPDKQYGTVGWDSAFQRQSSSTTGRKLRTFSPRDGFDVDSVFSGENLRLYAPKIHRIAESIRKARGICFAYSRYIKAGALPIAVALERMGFQRKLADGTVAPLITGATPVNPVCAICGNTNMAHTDHPFTPAYYVLLTSDQEVSPSFAGLIKLATSWPSDPVYGPIGSQVKVIIGSQVASEGLDLKCIREMHILDAWYHLNRTDQIIGRAIRFCSHSALRTVEEKNNLSLMALNNCLIYLHILRISDFETGDMYAYRLAIRKAQQMGIVQRLLKQHAWDCNLEMEAIVFTGLPKRLQIDAQGREITEYSVDDQDYTTYCDYQTCRHQCAIEIPPLKPEDLDSSTFEAIDAIEILHKKEDIVRKLFQRNVIIDEGVVQHIYSDLPWEIGSEALLNLLDKNKFRIRRGPMEGYLVKKAGYLVFQPNEVSDTEIPMTLRYARAFQLERKYWTPQLPIFTRPVEGVVDAPGPAPENISESTVPVAVTHSGTLKVAPASSKVSIQSILLRLKKWMQFINRESTIPDYITSISKSKIYDIWTWIVSRFHPIPEFRAIALHWWFDHILKYAEQRALYEYAIEQIIGGTEESAMYTFLRQNIWINGSKRAYRIYNPEKKYDIKDLKNTPVEYFCKSAADAEFTPCTSGMTSIIAKALGNQLIHIDKSNLNQMIGFIVAKDGVIKFKSLNIVEVLTHGSLGADCIISSNLGEHRPRIQKLQKAGRTQAELAPFMLPDADSEYETTKTEIRLQPGHLKDMTHQPLCIYMEFLTRLLDARHVMNLRWFLNSIDVVHSDIFKKRT